MKVCGIILAKENSNRFPGKNYKEYKGKPLFEHSLDLIRQFVKIEDIYICTDSSTIKIFCNGKYNIINRYCNVNRDDEPYLSVLKYAYQFIAKSYDIIITVLANSINHDAEAIIEGIRILEKYDKIQEVRSFDSDGIQNGIFLFREEFVLNCNSTLHEMGYIYDPGKEIHYKEELDERTSMD